MPSPLNAFVIHVGCIASCSATMRNQSEPIVWHTFVCLVALRIAWCLARSAHSHAQRQAHSKSATLHLRDSSVSPAVASLQ